MSEQQLHQPGKHKAEALVVMNGGGAADGVAAPLIPLTGGQVSNHVRIELLRTLLLTPGLKQSAP